MHCYRRVNADTIKIYISGKDHARKLVFSSYVHLPSINKISQYPYARVILCNVGEVYILGAWVLYLSFGTCWDVNIKQLFSYMCKHNL